MRVFKKLSSLVSFKRAVLTIGSFDGVHLGHQKILDKVKKLSQEVGGESVVLTFNPHPRHVLKGDYSDFKLISSVEEKIQLLERYGIDNVVVVPFTEEFFHLNPKEYVEDFLIKNFHPAYIVIGYDHRFGKARAGSIEDLRAYEQEGFFKLHEIQKQEVQEVAVSSTKIRKALQQGQVKYAAHLLGHPFSIKGIVTHGQRIGHVIGYPTANIEISDPNKLIPPYGVYAVMVRHNKQRYKGMLYIGDRPTLASFHNKTIEVNIFDFDKEIYGESLAVDFVEKIREDEKFENLEALKKQLAKDKIKTLKLLDPAYSNEE